MTEENTNQQLNPVRNEISNGVNEEAPAPVSSEAAAQTSEKEESAVVFETNGDFILFDENGKEIEKGETKIILDEEKFSLMPEKAQPISISLRDVTDFFAKDYSISLSLLGGGRLVISQFGYQYEDFVRALTKLRHEIIQKELLMKEGVRKTGFEANYEYQKDSQKYLGECEIDIYETGLVIKPTYGDLIRISFSEIIDFFSEDYKIVLNTEVGKLILSHLGEKFDTFSQALKQSLDDLSLKIQSILKEFLPEIDPLTIQRVGQLLKDGLAADKSQIDQISSKIWPGLEKELKKLGIKESYDYLRSLSKASQIFIGIKRDLMGDLTGEYIWFLVPVSSEKSGNFIAMEAASTIEGGGKATYFFKIPRGEKLDDLVKKINRCMLAINFRREPIYLKDEDLEKPDYLKYKTAVSKIPELKLLRQLFIGRVIHTSPENWKENVNIILNQNASKK